MTPVLRLRMGIFDRVSICILRQNLACNEGLVVAMGRYVCSEKTLHGGIGCYILQVKNASCASTRMSSELNFCKLLCHISVARATACILHHDDVLREKRQRNRRYLGVRAGTTVSRCTTVRTYLVPAKIRSHNRARLCWKDCQGIGTVVLRDFPALTLDSGRHVTSKLASKCTMRCITFLFCFSNPPAEW